MVQSRHSYEGVVVGPPDHGATRSGKEFCRFTLKVDNKTSVDCVIWNTVCSLDAFLIEAGSKVSVRGFWSDDKDKPPEFVVRWFEIAANKTSTAQDFTERVYEYYGGRGAYELALKERQTEMLRRGYVLVEVNGALVWEPKRFCIEVNGCWYCRMEFIMNQLGAEKVTQELMELVHSLSNVKTLRINSTGYEEKVKNLLSKALLVYEERIRNPS